MFLSSLCSRTVPYTTLRRLLFFSCSFSLLSFISLLVLPFRHRPLCLPEPTATPTPPTIPTSVDHFVFGVASTAASWPHRRHYARLWYRPGKTRAFAWIDSALPLEESEDSDFYPKTRVSEDTSRFPYTYPKGLRSAIRVARIVSETVRLGLPDVRWVVLCDDDTVFVTENLVRVLGKYDHEEWVYVGESSENVDQNRVNSFEMGFGGGGFAISYSLARILDKVMDVCLRRYKHLYGSDARVFACLAELGVSLTHEKGFHQVDFRGDAFGLLSSHPLAPLVSLHHFDGLAPIFPGMSKIEGLQHIFKAVEVDPGRILQQTVCYDKSRLWTVSVSWGYSVQIYDRIVTIIDLLPSWHTFMPWRRGQKKASAVQYMFNTRLYPSDPCKRPATFFFSSIGINQDSIQSNYTKGRAPSCRSELNKLSDLENITVFSSKMNLDHNQLHLPRRHCCDVFPISEKEFNVHIRNCNSEELVLPA